MNAFLRRNGEATDWHCAPQAMPEFLAALDYRLDAWISYRDLQAHHLGDARTRHLPEHDENYYRAVRREHAEAPTAGLEDVAMLAIDGAARAAPHREAP
jgi:hypothetical protein